MIVKADMRSNRSLVRVDLGELPERDPAGRSLARGRWARPSRDSHLGPAAHRPARSDRRRQVYQRDAKAEAAVRR